MPEKLGVYLPVEHIVSVSHLRAIINSCHCLGCVKYLISIPN